MTNRVVFYRKFDPTFIQIKLCTPDFRYSRDQSSGKFHVGEIGIPAESHKIDEKRLKMLRNKSKIQNLKKQRKIGRYGYLDRWDVTQSYCDILYLNCWPNRPISLKRPIHGCTRIYDTHTDLVRGKKFTLHFVDAVFDALTLDERHSFMNQSINQSFIFKKKRKTASLTNVERADDERAVEELIAKDFFGDSRPRLADESLAEKFVPVVIHRAENEAHARHSGRSRPVGSRASFDSLRNPISDAHEKKRRRYVRCEAVRLEDGVEMSAGVDESANHERRRAQVHGSLRNALVPMSMSMSMSIGSL